MDITHRNSLKKGLLYTLVLSAMVISSVAAASLGDFLPSSEWLLTHQGMMWGN